MRGIVVDSEEIEEGINYILKDYHGPELRGVEPEKIKGAIKFQEWLKEHCNTAPKTWKPYIYIINEILTRADRLRI